MAHVLVVEDDPQIRALVADVLQADGYSVSTAADGNEAIAAMRHGRPDAVLLDLMMPRMDGVTFVRTLRERTRWGRVPIVVMSAIHNPAQQAERLGALACVPKPFDLDDLVATVGSIARPN